MSGDSLPTGAMAAEAPTPGEQSPPTAPRKANAARAPRPSYPPMAGGSGDDEDQIARWMERAASHQTRALAWLRQARDPAAGLLTTQRRRDLLLRALEHLVSARRLLLRAQEASDGAELRGILDSHLERLATTTGHTERLLQDLDAAAEG